MKKQKYVLITAAHNEEAHIEKTIKSVISQTILPIKWVIVSDRSTDETDEIIARYATQYDFIYMLRISGHNQRDVGLKVNAFNAGYAQLKGIDYEFLGNLDADISLPSHYYEFLFEKFYQSPKLVLAGGKIFDFYNGKWKEWIARSDSVGGPVQMFRRDFFEDMGGYVMILGGGEDAVAEFKARRFGLEVKSFSEIKAFHHRPMGTEGRSIWRARFLQGVRDYLIGYHPLFEIAKCVRRVTERPYVSGSLFWLSGYFWAVLRKHKRTLPFGLIEYIRREQTQLLRKPFSIFAKKRDDKD